MKTYIVKYKSRTNKDLIKLGVPKWINIVCEKFSTREDAEKLCNEMNEHIKKFHEERINKDIYYIEEV